MKVYILIFLNLNYIVRGNNEVVVRIIGGPLIAQLLAEEHGHFYKGPVMGFEDTYIFVPIENVYENHQKRGHYTKKLFNDRRVLWVEEQVVTSRQKRDFIAEEDIPKVRVKRLEEDMFERSLADRTFNDELWTQQWYLRNTRSQLNFPHLDLNVLPVYDIGVTGKGIRILILDDGIEYTHDDLRENYDPEISWDCNEDDNDPFPRMDAPKSNNHGTRCAGEIAMSANNRKCGVGISFGAKIGGIKMLDGTISDRIEGTALGYAHHLVDIYSASWGPNDDGKTLDGPGRLATEAIKRGIDEMFYFDIVAVVTRKLSGNVSSTTDKPIEVKVYRMNLNKKIRFTTHPPEVLAAIESCVKGRGGKGAIYVWASGNGGHNNDNCNCDGYLSSPYTISIGSASQKGEFPWYGEACASTLAVTYSSGAFKDQMIVTTDVNNACTTKHTGTSASAPLAAGIIALALEANGNLTWRDIQHLIVWTSEVAPLIHNDGWQQNSAGFWFSERFGFGVMNAFNLISNALAWNTVPERASCHIEIPVNAVLSPQKAVKIVAYSNGCIGTEQEVKYLEHVEINTNINYTSRGALQIQLFSPSGTSVNILSPRKLDTSTDGFKNWTFMSVMTWGEVAEGTWIIYVTDTTFNKKNIGVVGNMRVILHGTKNLPDYMRDGPRDYDNDRMKLNFDNDIAEKLLMNSMYYH